MYTLPQEFEVWYIIPAIRRELTLCLIKSYGITYQKAGDILGITKAAISQYLKNKRASKIKLHDDVHSEICKSCNKLVKNKSDSTKEIMKILKYIRDNDIACEVCDINVRTKLEDCKEIKINYNILN